MNTQLYALGQRVQICEVTPDSPPQLAIAEGTITGFNVEDGEPVYQVNVEVIHTGNGWFRLDEPIENAAPDTLTPIADVTNLLTAIATLKTIPQNAEAIAAIREAIGA